MIQPLVSSDAGALGDVKVEIHLTDQLGFQSSSIDDCRVVG